MFVIYNLEKEKKQLTLGGQDRKKRTCVAPAVEPDSPNNTMVTRRGSQFNPKFPAIPNYKGTKLTSRNRGNLEMSSRWRQSAFVALVGSLRLFVLLVIIVVVVVLFFAFLFLGGGLGGGSGGFLGGRGLGLLRLDDQGALRE